MSSPPSIVVTGVGVVGALGEGRAALARGLREGRSPIARLPGEEWSVSRARIAAMASSFDPAVHVAQKWRGRVGRHAAFALACARLALEDAALPAADAAGEDTAVVVACALGGSREGEQEPTALHLARVAPSTATAWVSLALGTLGPGLSLASASCAGAQAIATAEMMLRAGRARRVLCGGVEAPLAPTVLRALDATGVLSRRNDDPQLALRPFDTGRDGTVVGEGGAILLLEREDDARARGARVLARIAGTGDAMEAHHPYALAPSGTAARAALRKALRAAGIDGREVGAVVAHGTGTRQNDDYERDVIASELGREVLVTATKPLTGHLLGAAGAMDSAVAITAMAAGFVPAIANCDDPSAPELNLVRGAAREASPARVAVLSHGLGGFSSAIVFSRD